MAKDSASKAPQEQPGYEEIVGRLEEVVRRLEGGNLSLEQSLAAFEEGIGLVRAGQARLDEAEKRVEQLLAGPRGEQVAPFEPEGREPERRGRGRASRGEEVGDDGSR